MAFLKALKQIDGWQGMTLTGAAQTVQVLAYPVSLSAVEDPRRDPVAEHRSTASASNHPLAGV